MLSYRRSLESGAQVERGDEWCVFSFHGKILILNVLIAILFVLMLFCAPAFCEKNETCFSCHSSKESGAPYVDAKEFSVSIHGNNLCISCHKDAAEVPHAAPLKPVSCGNCHSEQSGAYKKSGHGRAMAQGVREAATCVSCHGKPHAILPSGNKTSLVNRKNIPETCASCHADEKKMKKFMLSEKEPFDTYMHSVHGQFVKNGEMKAAVCTDCHGTHDLLPASNPESKIFRRNILTTCGKCHDNVLKVYNRSIHGKAIKAGIKEAPVCTDCHGEHTIRAISDPASSVWRGAVTETCAGCHNSKKINTKFGLPADRLKTYRDSYHGLAARGGDIVVANCASCHGWHDVLPSDDTRSSIYPKNLPQTCEKCHPGAQANLIKGKIHGGKQVEKHVVVRWVRKLYIVLIFIVIGAMLFHNAFDYFRKAMTGGHGRHETHPVERLSAGERLQHNVLLVTFTVLAYSGFALKYPDAWWAFPFQMVGGEALRKSVHRWTALIFILSAVYHIFYMAFSRRGKIIFKRKLMFKKRDLTEPVALQMYNMGLRNEKPDIRYPSYVERAEYWALAWGTLIMAGTGVLLAFNDYALKYLPLWISDLSTVVHFYEAVLACLSIFVWHFYWTIYDPDVYPMNMAWLTGYVKAIPVRKNRRDKT